jgi:kinesin family member 11
VPLNDPSTCRELTEYAGIIPRAVQHIFKKLEDQETEYTVRVSYLEIYNEELNDLLNDGEKQNLRIYEDTASKKGLSVDRLEELSVNNPQVCILFHFVDILNF